MNLKLLLLEDDPSSLNALEELLALQGFTVTACSRFEDAVSVTEVQDVLISDWNLGTEHTGADVVETLIERWPALQVIIVTACPLAPIRERLARLDAPTLLAKPLRFGHLLAAIRSGDHTPAATSEAAATLAKE